MFAAMASVVLASCVKNEPVATVEQGDLITFNSPVVAPATKATTIANAVAFPTGETFMAYAYYGAADAPYAGSTETVYISNKEFSDKGDYWGGETQSYYWPKNGDLTFCAYAPTSALSNGLAVDTENTNAGELTLTYAVPADIANQKDVLYSDWVCDKVSTNQAGTNAFSETGIDLPFHHALSAVKFAMKAGSAAAETNLKIQGITLSGLKANGSLAVPYTNTNVEWTLSGDNASYVVLPEAANASASTVLDAETTTNINATNQFMLLPQNVASAKLTVKYFISSDGGWIPQSTDITLSGSWERGKRYTYTLVFDLDEIKLAPVVKEDWTDVTGTTINQTL